VVKLIRYFRSEDIEKRAEDIVKKLQLSHIDPNRVMCIRSRGSRSRRTLARCHVLSRAMQTALNLPPSYVIEIISERFDVLDKEEQTKVLIHELMHIPKSFGGGFRHHNYVNRRVVEKMYKKLLNK
jgi:predicted metallopeptidase